MFGDFNLQVGCEFKAEVFNKNNEVVFETGTFHITVLNSGLLQWFSYSLDTSTTYINIGTGSSTPVATQTGLDNRLFSTNTLYTASTYEYSFLPTAYYTARKKVFQFAIGTCTGDFTELGLSRLSNANYFNRQLFKDVNGQDITVRVAADEGLRLTCLIKVYPDPTVGKFGHSFKLDLKGATSGSVTFSNGTTGVAITVAELNVFSTAYTSGTANYKITNTLYSNGNMIYPIQKSSVDNCYYISTLSNQLTGFCITTNTLVGNSGAPTLTEVIPYAPLTNFPYYSVSFQDITAGTTVNINYKKCLNLYWGSDFFIPFGMSQNALFSYAMGVSNIYAWDVTSSTYAKYTSVSTIIAPTIDVLTSTRDSYFAPGKINTSNTTVSRLALSVDSSSNYNFYQFVFENPITVNSQEEITFRSSISVSNYTP